jgi:uncharacterized protein YjbJ (UPF0337 family)
VSFLIDAKSSLGDAECSMGDAESSMGDAECSLGDAKSSLGDAKSSLGDATSSLGDAKSSLGDAKSSLGDAKSSLGDAKSSLGDAKSSLGDAKSSWMTLRSRWVTFTANNPIYTSARFLPPARIGKCNLVETIVSHGACIEVRSMAWCLGRDAPSKHTARAAVHLPSPPHYPQPPTRLSTSLVSDGESVGACGRTARSSPPSSGCAASWATGAKSTVP